MIKINSLNRWLLKNKYVVLIFTLYQIGFVFINWDYSIYFPKVHNNLLYINQSDMVVINKKKGKDYILFEYMGRKYRAFCSINIGDHPYQQICHDDFKLQAGHDILFLETTERSGLILKGTFLSENNESIFLYISEQRANYFKKQSEWDIEYSFLVLFAALFLSVYLLLILYLWSDENDKIDG